MASKDRKCSIADVKDKCDKVQRRALIVRLVRRGENIDVVWFTDLKGEQVMSSDVTYFDVVDVYFYRNNGLVLLTPIQDNDVQNTMSEN